MYSSPRFAVTYEFVVAASADELVNYVVGLMKIKP
jgi:hypothetical protein